jgi:hypothetical protein
MFASALAERACLMDVIIKLRWGTGIAATDVANAMSVKKEHKDRKKTGIAAKSRLRPIATFSYVGQGHKKRKKREEKKFTTETQSPRRKTKFKVVSSSVNSVPPW